MEIQPYPAIKVKDISATLTFYLPEQGAYETKRLE